MAHLWKKDATGWQAERLTGNCFNLAVCSTPHTTEGTINRPRMQIVRADADRSPAWALVASEDARARVNGRVPVGGICVLSDRDEVRTEAGAQYFFSTELLAEIEPFPAPERPVFCGRCRQLIATGTPAVRCPGASCGIWYHQSADLPCWTYDKCMICGRRSALDAGFSWTPEV
jgi:hypothetical protein